MKKKKIEPIEYDKDGNPIINLGATLGNNDWIRAARLLKRAEKGDAKAKEEFEKMMNTEMFSIDDE